jgi:hypothetical protein
MKPKKIAACACCGTVAKIRSKGMCNRCYWEDRCRRDPAAKEEHLRQMREWKKAQPYLDQMPTEHEIVRIITTPRNGAHLTIEDWISFIQMGRALHERMYPQVNRRHRLPHQKRANQCTRQSVA